MTTTGPLAVGSRFTITAKVGPIRVHSPYEVLQHEPPTIFGGRGVAGPVRFDEEYRLVWDGSCTELTQRIRAHPRGPFGLVAGPIKSRLQKLIAADLLRLGKLAEAEDLSS